MGVYSSDWATDSDPLSFPLPCRQDWQSEGEKRGMKERGQLSLSITEVEESKWEGEEGGGRTRVVDCQTECYFKQLCAAQSINRYVKLSCETKG